MRHFAGLLLGIILLPVFFALNWLVHYTTAQSGATSSRIWLLAFLGSFALFGIVLGFCLAARSISPVALLIGGLLIIAADVLLALPRLAGVQVNIPQLYDHPNITGSWLPLVAGFALLFGALVPGRWRRVHPEDELDDEFDVRGRDLFDDSARTQPSGSGRYGASPVGAGLDSERTAVQQRTSGGLEPAYDYQSESARGSS